MTQDLNLILRSASASNQNLLQESAEGDLSHARDWTGSSAHKLVGASGSKVTLIK